jgi:hypothetical protein
VYYKVVILDEKGDRFSAFAELQARVRYVVGEWAETVPWLAEKGYDLLVFNDVQAAKAYALTLTCVRIFPFEIWECEVEQVRDYAGLPEFLCVGALGTGEVYVDKNFRWPLCTCMAKRVKLVKKLHEVAWTQHRGEIKEVSCLTTKS